MMADEFYESLQDMARDTPQGWERHSGGVVTRTECGSAAGIAVSLIEGMMATARVLCSMDLSGTEAQEALIDLRGNSELKSLVQLWSESPQGRIRLPAEIEND